MANTSSCTSLHWNQSMDQSKAEQRPWGSFTVLAERDVQPRGVRGYKTKRIEVKAGNRLSLQRHHNREEHWIVVQGHGVVTLGIGTTEEDRFVEKEISTGSYIHIRPLQKHRVEAISDLVFVEVQIGDCDELDIERYSDDYGRAK